MLSLQISSGKEDRKGEEDYNDYPADFNKRVAVVQSCCERTPMYTSKFERR